VLIPKNYNAAFSQSYVQNVLPACSFGHEKLQLRRRLVVGSWRTF